MIKPNTPRWILEVIDRLTDKAETKQLEALQEDSEFLERFEFGKVCVLRELRQILTGEITE